MKSEPSMNGGMLRTKTKAQRRKVMTTCMKQISFVALEHNAKRRAYQTTMNRSP